jgi:response regulator RpfG family c-di-GMP phosphodiesterase
MSAWFPGIIALGTGDFSMASLGKSLILVRRAVVYPRPAMHAGTPTSQGPRADNQPAPARCRILLVDDDDRARAAGWLQAMGCEVLAERSGAAAMTRLAAETRGGPVHGVLLNIELPHIEDSVLDELRRGYPGTPLMVMAGAGHIHRLREAVRRGAREYLVTPLDGELFQQKCRRVFQGPPAVVR